MMEQNICNIVVGIKGNQKCNALRESLMTENKWML